MKKRIVLLVAAFLLSGGSLLLGGSAAWAQNDLGISKGKINKSLKRLEQLALIIRQVEESGRASSADRTTSGSNILSNGAHSSDGGTTSGSTSSSSGNTTISSNGAALLMDVAGRCKELSGEILQNMGRVSTLGTLHSSSQKLLQRTLLLSKVDELAKSLAEHKSNLEALKTSAQAGKAVPATAATGRAQATATAAQAGKAAQARIAKLVAKAIGIMEQEYEFQVLATGCMASALGAMD